MILDQIYKDQKYFEIIRRATGLLDVEKRYERIKDIAIHNIILAAKCKLTCVDDEDIILDWIIMYCVNTYAKSKDVTYIFALIVLEEYFIVEDVLLNKYADSKNLSINKSYINLIVSNQPVSAFLNALHNKIPKDVSVHLFDLLKTNGYNLDINYYNSIILLSDGINIKQYYDEILYNDLIPNLDTFNNLINKSDDKLALYFYNQLEFYSIQPNHTTYTSLITRLRNFDVVSHVFFRILDNEHTTNKHRSKLFISSIKFANSYKQVMFLLEFSYKYFSEISNKDFKSKKNIDLCAIEKLIKFSEDFASANSLFIKIEHKYTGKITVGILFEYLNKIEDEDIYWAIVGDYQNKLFPEIENNINTFEIVSRQCITSLFELLSRSFTSDRLHEIALNQIKKGINLPTSLLKKLILRSSPAMVKYYVKYILDNSEDVENSFWTSLITEADILISEEIFNNLKNHDYLINQIIYNAYIKKIPYLNRSLELLEEMEVKGFQLDKFTLSPLFRKCNSMEELFYLIQKSSNNYIYCDEIFFKTIKSISIENSLQFKNYFERNFESFTQLLEKSWFQLLIHINQEISLMRIVDCEITSIIHKRIFVKIIGEDSKASISINELNRNKIYNIFKFQYEGIEIYIGQKLKARIIDFDIDFGYVLSLK